MEKPTSTKLKSMKPGETRIFSESSSVRSPGAMVQSAATKAGIKVSTEVCYLVIPSTPEAVKVIAVTRQA